MSVHQFRPRSTTGHPRPNGASVDQTPLDTSDEFADDDPFGSVDTSNRLAHRVITPVYLSGHSGVPPPMCEEFHRVFFEMLEDVGDFDGLIITDALQIGGRVDRISPGVNWLADHPAPDVGAMRAAADEIDDFADVDLDDVYGQITAAIAGHSLALSGAVGSNPSLTFGSVESLVDYLDDKILEFALSTCHEYTEKMARSAFWMLQQVAGMVTVVGGALVQKRPQAADPCDA